MESKPITRLGSTSTKMRPRHPQSHLIGALSCPWCKTPQALETEAASCAAKQGEKGRKGGGEGEVSAQEGKVLSGRNRLNAHLNDFRAVVEWHWTPLSVYVRVCVCVRACVRVRMFMVVRE